MAWLNNDGLYIKFGREKGEVGKGGSFAYPSDGDVHVLEVDLTLTSLTSSAAIQSDAVRIPSEYTVKEVELFPTTAATSGGAATLNVGIIRSDRSTEHDNDGLVAAAALSAIDTVGETTRLTKGSTGAGALVGAELASTAKGGYLVAYFGTAAYTAGVVKVRVYLKKT